MALPILDGNQTAATLSTIITGGAHIPAHTVVSLGSQAISDIAQAVSGVELGPNTINALENISVTFGSGASVTIGNVVSVTGGLTDAQLRASSVTIGGSVQVSNFPATQSVTFSSPTITGSVSVLNLPATQTVTFTEASVTFGTAVVTGSVSVLNFPATQTTTFSAITGSVSVLNLPATQTVTFTEASVTFGTPVVTGSVSILNLPSTQTIAGTVTANAFGVDIINAVAQPIPLSDSGEAVVVDVRGGFGQANVPISGTVTANAGGDFGGAIEIVNDVSNVSHKIAVQLYDDSGSAIGISSNPLPVSGTVTANVGGIASGVTLPVRLFAEAEGGPSSGQDTLVVCDSAGQLLINAKSSGSSVIGYDGNAFVSVKQVSGSSITVGSLPNIFGTVTASPAQGTSVTTSNFTSTTASTTLASANSARRGLTIFNEGAGNLHICAGATATTAVYQVRLSAGDYWECPTWQTALTHSAQFATSGTARVTEIV